MTQAQTCEPPSLASRLGRAGQLTRNSPAKFFQVARLGPGWPPLSGAPDSESAVQSSVLQSPGRWLDINDVRVTVTGTRYLGGPGRARTWATLGPGIAARLKARARASRHAFHDWIGEF